MKKTYIWTPKIDYFQKFHGNIYMLKHIYPHYSLYVRFFSIRKIFSEMFEKMFKIIEKMRGNRGGRLKNEKKIACGALKIQKEYKNIDSASVAKKNLRMAKKQ